MIITAFVVYAVVIGLVMWLAGQVAPKGKGSPEIYASGERPNTRAAAPGYRQFFAIALFFAMLHLGALVLGSAPPSPVAAVYIAGLIVILLAVMREAYHV